MKKLINDWSKFIDTRNAKIAILTYVSDFVTIWKTVIVLNNWHWRHREERKIKVNIWKNPVSWLIKEVLGNTLYSTNPYFITWPPSCRLTASPAFTWKWTACWPPAPPPPRPLSQCWGGGGGGGGAVGGGGGGTTPSVLPFGGVMTIG